MGRVRVTTGDDWAELLPDLLSTISKKLNQYEDLTAFGGVCRSWRSVAAVVKNNFSPVGQVPWLLLAPHEDDDNNSSRDLYSLTKGGMVHRVHLPEAQGKSLHSSLGWLITISAREGVLELLHPLSRARIPLPSARKYIANYAVGSTIMFSTAALSASPSETADYVLMILFRPAEFLAYWKPGNTTWVRVIINTSRRWFSIQDLIYHSSSGQFYAINDRGELFSIDINGLDHPITANLVGSIPSDLLPSTNGRYLAESGGHLHLAESGGHLLAVVKKYLHDDHDQRENPTTVGMSTHGHHGIGDCMLVNKPVYNYLTTSFQVYRFDDASSNNNDDKWHVMNDLGGRSIFIGQRCAPISVLPCGAGNIRPDCIYFTDTIHLNYLRKGDISRDGIEMGVYSLKEQKADILYQGGTKGRRCFLCRPFWVIPSF